MRDRKEEGRMRKRRNGMRWYMWQGAILIAVCFAVSGCGRNVQMQQEQIEGSNYPLNSQTQLTVYCAIDNAMTTQTADINNTPFKKALEEATGIRFKYVFMPKGQEISGFELMVAANDMTDIIEYGPDFFKYGPSKAIQDGIIEKLNPYIESFSPNLNRYLEQNPEIRQMITTSEGDYYFYPFIRGDSILTVYRGGMIRKDILDQAGVPVPETIEEWEIALQALQDAGFDAPLTMELGDTRHDRISAFVGAFGVAGTYFVEDGAVKFGPYMEEYGDYLRLLARWYQKGWLDNDFRNHTQERIYRMVQSNEIGALFGTGGGDLGGLLTALKRTNPNAELVPVKYPVMNKGERPKFGHREGRIDFSGYSISTDCIDMETAARFLDFAYSEQGHLLYNFGIEGESYEWKDGYPTYTEKVMDYEQNGNLTVQSAMSRYMHAYTPGAYVQDRRYIEQYYQLPEQHEALRLWMDTDTEQYRYPDVSYTMQEYEELSKIEEEVNTYMFEMVYKLVSGQEPMEKLDNYFMQLKNLGIERALLIRQNAYDRYQQQNSRKGE